MSVRKYFLAILLLAGMTAVSCAVQSEEDADYSGDRVMKAWINVNYPGLKPYGDTGAYILEMEQGQGPAVSDSAYVWAHYVKYRLDRSIASTNIQRFAEQLGTFTRTTCYSSDIWRIDQGYLPDDLETILKTMRSGGHVKVALPNSASGHSQSFYSAFTGTKEDENLVIDLTIAFVIAFWSKKQNTKEAEKHD